MIPQIRIGTSGWNYQHWKGLFYPPNCRQSEWLEYYVEHFDTVELNATFYGLPKLKTFENWRLRTPDGFLWAVKANKYITHIKRLKDPRQPLERFYEAVSGLKEKSGPVLFQLPPSLSFREQTFRHFCQSLDVSIPHALEVRHPSWVNDRLFSILQEHNMAFCIADTAGRYPYHEEVTADFVYVRLHGSKKLYASDYSEEELRLWAHKIRKWNTETFLYFDNDFGGYAVKNAGRLKQILNLH